MLPERKSQTYKIYGDALIEEFVSVLISADIDFDVKAVWKEQSIIKSRKEIDFYFLTIYDAIKELNGGMYFDPDIFKDGPIANKEEKEDEC